MVNPGHRSKGCATCRLRRIKCDEARPHCRRCASANRTCIGYREAVSETPGLASNIHTLEICSDDHSTSLIRRNTDECHDTDGQLVGQSIIEILRTCFERLWDPAQSRGTRRLLLQNYQTATQILRTALSFDRQNSNLVEPIRLLALYEMTVASDWDDTTWQTHLDGYLSIMSQPEQQPARKAQDTILAKALSYAGEDGSVHSFQSLGLADDMDEAAMLLEVSKLRLRILARKLCMLLRGATPPRKLDVQKLQSSVKQIYADLQLGTLAESPRKTVVARTTNIEYAAVRIVAAGLLIRCGQFLHPTGLFNTTRHFTKLSSSICVAADQICATVASMHPTAICPNTINPIRNRSRPPLAETVMDALSVIWPLFVVGTTANTDHKHRAWAQKLLLTLGNNARIPKALHLVSSSVAFETDLVLDLEANN